MRSFRRSGVARWGSTGRSDAGTSPGSTSGWTREEHRISSSAIRCRAFLRGTAICRSWRTAWGSLTSPSSGRSSPTPCAASGCLPREPRRRTRGASGRPVHFRLRGAQGREGGEPGGHGPGDQREVRRGDSPFRRTRREDAHVRNGPRGAGLEAARLGRRGGLQPERVPRPLPGKGAARLRAPRAAPTSVHRQRAARTGAVQQQGARQAADDRQRDPHAALPPLHRRSGRRTGAILPAGRETGERGRIGRHHGRQRRRRPCRPAPPGEMAEGGVPAGFPRRGVRGRAGIQRRIARERHGVRPAPGAPPGGARVPEPALAALHLRFEVESVAPVVRGDRPGLSRRRFAGNRRAALGDHPGVRPDLRSRGLRPGRLPDELERGAVRPRGEPEPRHLARRRDVESGAGGGAFLPGPHPRDPAAGPGHGGPVTRVRRIEPGDREAIRELIAGTGAFKPFEVDVALELVDVALTRKEQDDYHPYVLVEDDGTVVAYACFGKNAMTVGTFDLYWIATRADRMGKGYGRAILSFVEEEVHRRGGYLLVIETSSKESYGSTRQFYDKVGCTLAARLPDYYADGDDKLIYLKRVR